MLVAPDKISTPPRLLPVPAFHHELVIKATQTGIVVLKDGRYKKRYTGSKYSTVDINGKFYERSSDLAKLLREESFDPKKRKIRRLPPADSSLKIDSAETGSEDTKIILSPKKIREPEYRVNKMEIRQRILGMINTMKGSKELYFWTVTFPGGMPDNLCYQAFNIWLTTLRQKKMLKNYIWIAERQDGKRLTDPTKEATGTIHFHLAIPHKMHVVTANRLMRTTLSTFAKKKLINYSVFQAKRYNGVDIKKNRNTGRVVNFAIKKGSRALANYLTKYVTKNEGSFSHLAWHNSRGFSQLFTGITFTIPEFLNYGFKELLLSRSVVNNEFFMFFPWLKDPPEAIVKHLFEVNSFLQLVADSKNT